MTRGAQEEDEMRQLLVVAVLSAMAWGGRAGANTPTEGAVVDRQGHPAALREQEERALQRLEAMSQVGEDGTYAGATEWVAEYIRRWAATNPNYAPNKQVAARADELARVIVEASRELDVDYRVATVICQVESGFREGSLKGKVDGRDHGLMQVNGGTATTSEGQVREGLAVWTGCRRSCGGLEATMTCYATGKCAFPTERGALSAEAWTRLAFKQRGVQYRLRLFERAGLTRNGRFVAGVPGVARR
jgi:hypothetical protein